VSYLCSSTYAPGREHGVNPLCKTVGLDFGLPESELLLSPKDTDAPGLLEAKEQGILPDYDECLKFYEQLNAGHKEAN
jgi:dTDP-4-dehydrorhamnose 3,5-epimerase